MFVLQAFVQINKSKPIILTHSNREHRSRFSHFPMLFTMHVIKHIGFCWFYHPCVFISMKQKKWFDTTPRTPSYCGMVIDWSPSPCLLQSLHAMIINGTTVRVFGYLALSCFQAKYPNPNRNSFWQAAVSWEFFQILRALVRREWVALPIVEKCVIRILCSWTIIVFGA